MQRALRGCRGKHQHPSYLVFHIPKQKEEKKTLKQNMTCAKYGSFVAALVICTQQYADETANVYHVLDIALRCFEQIDNNQNVFITPV